MLTEDKFAAPVRHQLTQFNVIFFFVSRPSKTKKNRKAMLELGKETQNKVSGVQLTAAVCSCASVLKQYQYIVMK